MPVDEEVLVLDPGPTGLDLTAAPFEIEAFVPGVAKARPLWAVGADADGGVLDDELRYDNVDATQVRLRIWIDDETQMDQALAALGQLTDKLQECARRRGGLPVEWTPARSTRSYTMYWLLAELDDLPIEATGENAGWLLAKPVVPIRVTRRPFLYGPEAVLVAIDDDRPVADYEFTGVPGDVAAEGRLIVSDLHGIARRHVEWGIEQLEPGAVPPETIIDSDSLVTAGFSGAQGALASGAHDPNASGSNVVTVGLTTRSTAICGVGNQPHAGVFRVKARVLADSLDVRVRLAWQAGDGPITRNRYARPPVAHELCEIDLGLVTVPPTKLGPQRWSGQLEGIATALVDDDGARVSQHTVVIDALWLIPASKGYGKVRAAYVPVAGALVGRDEFVATNAGANLDGRAAPQGGLWETIGSPGDFVFDDNAIVPGGEGLKRTTVSDASPRFARLGGSFAAIDVAARVVSPAAGAGGPLSGVFARFVDESNYVRAVIASSAFGGNDYLRVHKVRGGAVTTLKASPRLTARFWYALHLTVFASGAFIAEAIDDAGAVFASLAGFDADLATGGSLEDGRAGVVDYNPTPTAFARSYDDVAISTPPAEPIVIYPNRRLELRHDGALREDVTGTYWGRPPAERGSRVWIPPSGDRDLVTRIAVKARRNDVDVDIDGPIGDEIHLQVAYTPRYLTPR